MSAQALLGFQHYEPVGEAHWRSLRLFNVFRVFVVGGLLIGSQLRLARQLAESGFQLHFFASLAIYAVLALGFFLGIAIRRPRFDVQLTAHVGADVVFIISLLHVVGGVKSGLGLLLLPLLAAAGLLARGRMTLFHASLASIALLLETWYESARDIGSGDYFNASLLCLACFAVAWVAHRLARYAEENRMLAERRGLDLANLGQLNARILRDMSDGVLVVDQAGVIHQFNEQLLRLGALLPERGARLHDWSLTLSSQLAQWREGGWTSAVPLQLHRKYLRPRFVALNDDRLGDVMIYLEDMDRLQRESQQLKLAALGRLTANLAHEIRNPLGAISHAAQLLKEEASTDPLVEKLTRIINDNSHRLNRMVTDVLELNRRDRVERVSVNLAEWLQTFVEEFTQVEGIGVTIPLEAHSGIEVRFDPGHLHQILWNLMRNGWRYCSQQPGSLSLMLQVLDGVTVLDVHNDGPPVPSDAQTQLFEPFFTTEAKGTGLGLYIAREICAANGAILEYVSPPLGGACFRIAFGVNDAEKSTA